jgi:COX assembly mitochondrial protein 2
MHPPLDRDHPQCQDVIMALHACHEEHSYSKFWGACNDAKAALDQCFRAEKQLKRRKNFLKAKGRYTELRALEADEKAGRTGGTGGM